LHWRAWSISLEGRAEVPESASRPVSLGGGRVESTLYGGQLVPCRHVGYFAFCGVGMLGLLQAWGADVVPHNTRTTLFAAAGVRLGIEWPLPASFAVRFHADGFVNLHRPTLALGRGENDIWSAPPVGGTLALGIERHFP
jgi:hypothetical protein